MQESSPPMSDDDFVEICKSGDTTKVEKEIINGANVESFSYQDHRKDSALMWATRKGQSEVVKILLQNGADINAKNLYGTTALMWSARKGYPEVAEILLLPICKETKQYALTKQQFFLYFNTRGTYFLFYFNEKNVQMTLSITSSGTE